MSEPGRFISEPGRFISENKEPLIVQSDWSIHIEYIIILNLFTCVQVSSNCYAQEVRTDVHQPHQHDQTKW